MKKCFVMILITGLAIIGCGDRQNYIIEDANNISGNITVKLNETFNISLSSNMTTGYSWRMGELEPGVVQQTNYEYKENNPQNLVGAGGEEIWYFNAVGTGKIAINFQYVRPWESEEIAPAKTASYVITVKK